MLGPDCLSVWVGIRFDSKVKNLTFPSKFPITIRGEEGAFKGIDLLYTSNYSDPTWLCDPNWYGADDGCHW